ncbi:MAG TPA: response regulator [Tepidiformaceae bacterium]|nr:response regulator [Tepidiformaceae bacterium]HMO95985.1 response regulator [Tepidiformaceae bacterium]
MNQSETLTRRESVASSDALRGPVLVVDGDSALRRVVRLVLEGAGWRTFTAADMEAAEEIVRAERPKLVIAEVKLPNEQLGQELARRFAKNRGWRPRVALMSAYPRPRRGYEDYFLRKPLEFDQIIALLESIDGEPSR